MLDDEMDHIIREAAENHHPPYNDSAWDKMELQLDKHLPQKKDRKRLIFLLLFFLLLGSGTFIVLHHKFGSSKNVIAEKNVENKNQPAANTAKTGDLIEPQQNVKTVTQPAANADENTNEPLPVLLATENKTVATDNKPALQNSKTKAKSKNANLTIDLTDVNDEIRTSRKSLSNAKLKYQNMGKTTLYDFADIPANTNDPLKNKKQTAGNKFKKENNSATEKSVAETAAGEDMEGKRKPIAGKTNSKLAVNITAPGTDSDEGLSNILIAPETSDNKTLAATVKDKKETAKDTVKAKPDDKLIAAHKKPAPPDKKKKSNKFTSNFGLTFSVGPDISFVKLNNTGRTTLTYGAGLSYAFAKRFTARAGFYVSKKIYQATPDQYHNTIYPNLTSINANCKVFEIPLGLSYSFGQRNKHKWFAGAGLSSFIMKTEDYVYNYKNAAGQTYTYANGISNENKHYFSVLNLSGGYQYQFNKRLSVQAEPYLNLPLSGIGLGKIKLNSAGVLFTLTVKPFSKK